MKKDLELIAVIFVMWVLSGCLWRQASCDCYKESGCSTMQAFDKANDTLIAELIICADSNRYFDSTYLQNERTFLIHYPNARFVKIDTDIKTETVHDLKQNMQAPYKANGYDCFCQL